MDSGFFAECLLLKYQAQFKEILIEYSKLRELQVYV